MREQMERKNRKEKKTKNSKVSRFVSRNFGTILKLALLIAIVAAIGVGVRVINVSESKTTKIGFEDIGEMATQSAYCTEVNVTEDSCMECEFRLLRVNTYIVMISSSKQDMILMRSNGKKKIKRLK